MVFKLCYACFCLLFFMVCITHALVKEDCTSYKKRLPQELCSISELANYLYLFFWKDGSASSLALAPMALKIPSSALKTDRLDLSSGEEFDWTLEFDKLYEATSDWGIRRMTYNQNGSRSFVALVRAQEGESISVAVYCLEAKEKKVVIKSFPELVRREFGYIPPIAGTTKAFLITSSSLLFRVIQHVDPARNEIHFSKTQMDILYKNGDRIWMTNKHPGAEWTPYPYKDVSVAFQTKTAIYLFHQTSVRYFSPGIFDGGQAAQTSQAAYSEFFDCSNANAYTMIESIMIFVQNNAPVVAVCMAFLVLFMVSIITIVISRRNARNNASISMSRSTMDRRGSSGKPSPYRTHPTHPTHPTHHHTPRHARHDVASSQSGGANSKFFHQLSGLCDRLEQQVLGLPKSEPTVVPQYSTPYAPQPYPKYPMHPPYQY